MVKPNVFVLFIISFHFSMDRPIAFVLIIRSFHFYVERPFDFFPIIIVIVSRTFLFNVVRPIVFVLITIRLFHFPMENPIVFVLSVRSFRFFCWQIFGCVLIIIVIIFRFLLIYVVRPFTSVVITFLRSFELDCRYDTFTLKQSKDIL